MKIDIIRLSEMPNESTGSYAYRVKSKDGLEKVKMYGVEQDMFYSKEFHEDGEYEMEIKEHHKSGNFYLNFPLDPRILFLRAKGNIIAQAIKLGFGEMVKTRDGIEQFEAMLG